MNNSAVVTYTTNGIGRLLENSGSQAWVLDSKRVRKTEYLVCVQNREPANHGNDWGQATAEHGEAFFIGKISDVVLVRNQIEGKPKRWLIKVSEYAEISYSDKWDGARNPVAYTTLDQLGIDISTLNFLPMPEVDIDTDAEVEGDEHQEDEPVRGITIKEAKKLLALYYETSSDDIEIIIRG